MVVENPYRAGPTSPLHLTMRTSPSRYFLAALGVLFVCFFVPPILTHPTRVEIECAAAGPGVASCDVREVRLIGVHASKIDVRGVTEVRAEGADESVSRRVTALAPTRAVPFSRAFCSRADEVREAARVLDAAIRKGDAKVAATYSDSAFGGALLATLMSAVGVLLVVIALSKRRFVVDRAEQTIETQTTLLGRVVLRSRQSLADAKDVIAEESEGGWFLWLVRTDGTTRQLTSVSDAAAACQETASKIRRYVWDAPAPPAA